MIPAQRRLERDRQLLVAASPHDDIADTHWYRADFDHLFVREARNMGVDYLDETELLQHDGISRRNHPQG